MKRISTCVFLALLCFLSLGSIIRFPWQERLTFFKEQGGGITGLLSTAMDTAKKSTDILCDNIPAHDSFIQLYGGAQRLSGNRAVSDTWVDNRIYRMVNGSISFVLSSNDPFPDASLQSISNLSDVADQCNVQKLFVLVPQKGCSRQEAYASRGVVDISDEVDEYRASVFEAAGFSVLNLHDRMHEQKMDHLNSYFATDHHWTFATGLWAAGEIATSCRLDTSLLDANQYDEKVYERFFLGSEGKRIGTLYCAPDDLRLPVPKFETDYVLDIPNKNIHKTGSFEDTVFFEDELIKDYFHATPYRILLKGDHPLLTIQNRNNPDGPRVLMIKDSFSDCVAPYLAAECGELTLLDTRYYEDSVLDYLREHSFDTLLVTISARTPNEFFLFS